MNTRKWTAMPPRLTAAERRAVAHAKALDQCRQGQHSSTPTFRPSETVCLICGMVVYCPYCLKDSHLLSPQVHAYPMVCPAHQNAEVQA